MRSATRNAIALAAALGGLAMAWLAGAAPVWQGFGPHAHP